MSEDTTPCVGRDLRVLPARGSRRAPVVGGMFALAAVLGGFWALTPPGRPPESVARQAGADDRPLRAVPAPGGGIVLENSTLRLHARLGVNGLRLRSDGVGLGLRLIGYGYGGGALRAVASVAPRAQANRVAYSRGPLTEWYSNTTAGLEQGFTLIARPAGGRAGPLTLALALSGNGQARRAPGGKAIVFTKGSSSLAYRGLTATDAGGRRLPARIDLSRGTLRLRIDDGRARYPLRIDPFIAPTTAPASAYARAVLSDTPLAYYRLGEPGGATASDSSGNGLDATYQSGPQLATPGALLGDADTAATASGAGVMLSQSGDRLPTGHASRTLEGWVNYLCCTGAFNLFQYGDLVGGHGFTVSLGDHANTITVSGATTSVSTNTLTGGDGFARSGWHLIDVSYDGNLGAVEIYQDGQIIGGGHLGDASTTTPGQGLQVNSNYAGFKLDEVAIYGNALSPGQIDAHWTAGGANPDLGACAATPTAPYATTVLADAPTAYFRLGELAAHPQDRVAFDSSGHCANAAYGSGVGPSPGALIGDADGAVTSAPGGMTLSGSSDALPAGKTPRTLEAWVNYVCCTGAYNLFQYGDLTGGHAFTVALGDHANTIAVSGGGTPVTASTLGGGDGFARSGWHLVDVTYDGGTVEIYQDGQIIGGGPLGDAGTTTPGQGLQVNANYAGFRLDEVAIYPSALSSARVNAHYVAQSLTPPGTSILGGTALLGGGGGAQGARVQACPTSGAACTVDPNAVDSSGAFHMLVADGAYTVTIFPPAGSPSGPQTIGPLTVPPSNRGLTATFAAPGGLPSGVTFSSPSTGTQQNVVPGVNWGEPSTVTADGCKGGFGALEISGTNTQNGQPETRSVGLFEKTAGTGRYVADVPPLAPIHGSSSVSGWVSCPGATSVLPSGGALTGGTPVLLAGSNFTGATQVMFGSNPAGSFKILQDNIIEAVSPAGAGQVPVSVNTSGGQSTPIGNFSYFGVTSLDTTSGPAGGGTSVTIRGQGFSSPAKVIFGLAPSSSVTVVSPTEIRAVAPAGLGTVDVQVVQGQGVSQPVANDAFANQNGPPGSSNINQTTASNPQVYQQQVVGACTLGLGDWQPITIRTQFPKLCEGAAHALRAALIFGQEGETKLLTGGALFLLRGALGEGAIGAATLAIAAPILEFVIPAFAIVSAGQAICELLTGDGCRWDFWNLFIDPSGTVADTQGNPIAGAAATVLAHNPGTGGFSAVDPASGTIEPAVNPETTGSSGAFHWDALAGTYEVQASASGCHAPADPSQPNVLTPAFVIPPPAVGLMLTLECPGTTPPAPAVTGLSAGAGPAGGGNTIDIEGTGLASASAVRFGATPATQFQVLSPYAVAAVVPAGSGTVDITVDTKGGASPAGALDRYTYRPTINGPGAPTITSVTPPGGPLSGGTVVKIKGTGLDGATGVDFGGTPSQQVTAVSPTEVHAVAPAAALSSRVDLTVATAAGTSAPTAADTYVYGSPHPPLATTVAVSPSENPTIPGHQVTFTAAVAPTDGGGSVAFYADGSATPIDGCPAQTLTLSGATYQSTCATSNLAGGDHAISAAYSGDAGYAASSGSTHLTVVGPPTTITLPSISGTPRTGQTLTEANGTWTNTPTSLAYQWQDCDAAGNSCAAIPGATGQTYRLAPSDVGHTIRVAETASNAGGPSSPASSPASGVVQSPAVPAVPPSNQSAPAITGTARAGTPLSASTGTWAGTPPISYTYRWQRCHPGCADIAGATGSSYALTAADLGARLQVVVTAANSAGSAAATSPQLGPIAAAAPTAAQIQALLLTEITPTGKAARIAAILRAGGYNISFRALIAGAARDDWYYLPAGAHLAARARRQPLLVATGTSSLPATGHGQLELKLTTAGRKLLKSQRARHATRLKLTAKASFTPTADAAVIVRKAFTIRR